MNKMLLAKLKQRKGNIQRVEARTQEEYRDTIPACRHGVTKAKAKDKRKV